MSKPKYEIVDQRNGFYQVRDNVYKRIEKVFDNRADAERYVQQLVEDDRWNASNR